MNVCIALRPSIENNYFTHMEGINKYIINNYIGGMAYAGMYVA